MRWNTEAQWGPRFLRVKRPARERCIGYVLGRSEGNVSVKHIKLEGDNYLGVHIAPKQEPVICLWWVPRETLLTHRK